MSKASEEGAKPDNQQPIHLPTEDLLRMLLSVTARLAFPAEQLRLEVVGKVRFAERWINAYNACNGLRSQMEIVRLSGIDPGDLSRAIKRWVEAGVLFRVGANELPLHLYMLPLDDGQGNSISAPQRVSSSRDKATKRALDDSPSDIDGPQPI
jgi:hypothetical protein